MKIKFWDRLILYVGGFIVLLAGACLFVAGVQQPGVLSQTTPGWVRLVCSLCGLLTMAFGFYILVFPSLYGVKRHEFVVQRTDSGELRIAVKAIMNLVQKCIDLHEEIHVNSLKILTTREGVVIDLTATLDNNISIPLAVASLQKQIKQYLVASSGIEVREVRVSVESAQDAAPETAAQEEELPAEKPAAKEQKAPLHQRLFGRPDVPAIVPEPPKEEESQASKDTEEPAGEQAFAAEEAVTEEPVTEEPAAKEAAAEGPEAAEAEQPDILSAIEPETETAPDAPETESCAVPDEMPTETPDCPVPKFCEDSLVFIDEETDDAPEAPEAPAELPKTEDEFHE